MPKKRKAATSRVSNLQVARDALSVKRQKSVDPVAASVTGMDCMVEREADVDVMVRPHILNASGID
jgi:hypothetical protein